MNIYHIGATPIFFYFFSFVFGCLWSSAVTQRDAATAVCSGWFGGSLALTSTAEPWATFTTDLASHFQCCSGRPLRSVSAVPSSFHITSLRTHPLSPLLSRPPALPYLSQSAFVSKGGEQKKKKNRREEKRRKQVKPFPSPLPLLPLLCRYQCLARKAKWIHERSHG